MITLLSLLSERTRNQKMYHHHHQRLTTLTLELIDITSITAANNRVSCQKTFFDGLHCVLLVQNRFFIAYIYHINHKHYNVEKLVNFWLDCCCLNDAYDNYIGSTLSYLIRINDIRANIAVLCRFNYDHCIFLMLMETIICNIGVVFIPVVSIVNGYLLSQAVCIKDIFI